MCTHQFTIYQGLCIKLIKSKNSVIRSLLTISLEFEQYEVSSDKWRWGLWNHSTFAYSRSSSFPPTFSSLGLSKLQLTMKWYLWQKGPWVALSHLQNPFTLSLYFHHHKIQAAIIIWESKMFRQSEVELKIQPSSPFKAVFKCSQDCLRLRDMGSWF